MKADIAVNGCPKARAFTEHVGGRESSLRKWLAQTGVVTHVQYRDAELVAPLKEFQQSDTFFA